MNIDTFYIQRRTVGQRLASFLVIDTPWLLLGLGPMALLLLLVIRCNKTASAVSKAAETATIEQMRQLGDQHLVRTYVDRLGACMVALAAGVALLTAWPMVGAWLTLNGVTGMATSLWELRQYRKEV